MAIEQLAPSPLSHFDSAELLDVLSTGVVMVDAHLCVVYANVGAQDLLAVGVAQENRDLVERNALFREAKNAAGDVVLVGDGFVEGFAIGGQQDGHGDGVGEDVRLRVCKLMHGAADGDHECGAGWRGG